MIFIKKKILETLSPAGPRGRLMILTYHRVPADPDSLLPEEPDADRFREQMRWMRSYCDLLPLPEAAERLMQGDIPARAASITFDDGYADNFEVAAPILDELGIPATFFIATGAVETGAMWNDRVIEGVRYADRVVDVAELHSLEVEDLPVECAADRIRAIATIIDRIKYLESDHRASIAEAVYRSSCGDRPLRLMMDSAMVAGLAAKGHDIGAHTVSHPILTAVDARVAAAEIEKSRDWVATVTGSEPRSFAYPNGKRGVDFDESHMKMIRDAGFRLAVSTDWGCATRTSDSSALPRFTPWEYDRFGFWSRLIKTQILSYR